DTPAATRAEQVGSPSVAAPSSDLQGGIPMGSHGSSPKQPIADHSILGSGAIPAVEEAQIKGSFVLAAIEYVRQIHGNDILQRVLADLPPEVRSRMQSSNLSTTWLPLRYYDATLRTIDRILGRGDGAMATVLGIAAAEHDLPGSLRAFLH